MFKNYKVIVVLSTVLVFLGCTKETTISSGASLSDIVGNYTGLQINTFNFVDPQTQLPTFLIDSANVFRTFSITSGTTNQLSIKDSTYHLSVKQGTSRLSVLQNTDQGSNNYYSNNQIFYGVLTESVTVFDSKLNLYYRTTINLDNSIANYLPATKQIEESFPIRGTIEILATATATTAITTINYTGFHSLKLVKTN
ncbi:MAG: hypothetical protein QM539_02685 [Alphaproteobacteria bacterium]|nr:hypothetical protein [Alphaproteobacteria bacterium]